MARSPDFDLVKELAKASFTPAQRDAPALVELIVRGDEPAASRAAPALARLRDVRAIDARIDAVEEAAQARLVGALGLIARAQDPAAASAVIARLGDRSARVRRAAAIALGKLGGDAARSALVARWDASDVTPDERRALAEALGKVGGADALARLQGLVTDGDAELARRRDRALLMADRTARRDDASDIAADATPPSPVVVRLACRGGLASLLVEELASIGIAGTATRDDSVDTILAGPWSSLFGARLWTTGAFRRPLVDAPDLATAITQTLLAGELRALLAAWTRGPIRWRLGFARGHKRSIIWRVARDVSAAAPELVNDPTATTWDILVDDEARVLEIAPRRLVDPRFGWRVAEVPAASHPTVAAALAWSGDARAGDRVWDPFCGSAAELIERARRGPYASLAGTDIDDDALAAARRNGEAAGVAIALGRADARSHDPGPIDLIITNPPLGSRLKLDASALLVEALPNLVSRLAPNGRLVWITPTRRTTPVAERLGLRRARSLPIDLGGVRGQLERWDR